MKSLFDVFRRPPIEQPMSRLLAMEAAMPLKDAARTVRSPLLRQFALWDAPVCLPHQLAR